MRTWFVVVIWIEFFVKFKKSQIRCYSYFLDLLRSIYVNLIIMYYWIIEYYVCTSERRLAWWGCWRRCRTCCSSSRNTLTTAASYPLRRNRWGNVAGFAVVSECCAILCNKCVSYNLVISLGLPSPRSRWCSAFVVRRLWVVACPAPPRVPDVTLDVFRIFALLWASWCKMLLLATC
jgi:hypothetical protein